MTRVSSSSVLQSRTTFFSGKNARAHGGGLAYPGKRPPLCSQGTVRTVTHPVSVSESVYADTPHTPSQGPSKLLCAPLSRKGQDQKAFSPLLTNSILKPPLRLPRPRGIINKKSCRIAKKRPVVPVFQLHPPAHLLFSQVQPRRCAPQKRGFLCFLARLPTDLVPPESL